MNTATADVQREARRSILHPTDFSSASLMAYSHALRLALCGKATLTMVHMGGRDSGRWHEHPGIRDTLSRWGIIDRQASRAAVAELGISATKIHLGRGRRISALMKRADKAEADLVVMSTKRKWGFFNFFQPSMALSICRVAQVSCLILPTKARGIVDRRTGDVTVREVLLVLPNGVDPARAVEETLNMLRDLRVENSVIKLLHLRGKRAVVLPDSNHEFLHIHSQGSVAKSVLEHALSPCDLVVIPAGGAFKLQRWTWGSAMPKVIKHIQVPLLVVPGGR